MFLGMVIGKIQNCNLCSQNPSLNNPIKPQLKCSIQSYYSEANQKKSFSVTFPLTFIRVVNKKGPKVLTLDPLLDSDHTSVILSF